MNRAAGVLFCDGQGRVLMVKSAKPYWDLPGGQVEAGETPRDAAQREVKEELGLTIHVGRLLVVDHLPSLTAYVFAGHLNPAHDPVADGIEVYGWAWLDLADRRERVLPHAPILHARVSWARYCQAERYCRYLENGAIV